MKTDHSLERIKDGELAFHLQEFDEFDDGLLVRWQEVAVLHNGRPCSHYEPLGPSMSFRCGPVKILATVATDKKIEFAGDTAGDLREHANRFRTSGFMEEVIAERQDKSTLYEDWLKFREMKKALTKQRSRTLRALKGYKSVI